MPSSAEPLIVQGKYIDPQGRVVWQLSPKDFARVRAGYACGNCLEPFTMYQAACHACGAPTRSPQSEMVDGRKERVHQMIDY